MSSIFEMLICTTKRILNEIASFLRYDHYLMRILAEISVKNWYASEFLHTKYQETLQQTWGKTTSCVLNPYRKQQKNKLVAFLQKAIVRRESVYIFSATAQIDRKCLRNNFTKYLMICQKISRGRDISLFLRA